MQSNNFLKRKKEVDLSGLKPTKSESSLNRTSKSKQTTKSLLSTVASRSTLGKSNSAQKLKKNNKKVKNKENNSNSLKKAKSGKELKIVQEKSKNLKSAPKKDKKEKKEQKIEELTERKKNHLEFFTYKNNPIPIENTEQRKIIFKIKLIDEETKKFSHQTIKMVEVSTSVEKIPMIDQEVQMALQQKMVSSLECQTDELSEILSLGKSEEETNSEKVLKDKCEKGEKCFVDTLSEIEFLYLPDQKNFEGFSREEKTHYKELLNYLAKKFDESEQEILDEGEIELRLKNRELRQRGILVDCLESGLPTHTQSIISYVCNLFCFIELEEENELIDNLNQNYGINPLDRLALIRTGMPQKLQAYPMNDSTFWKFESQLHEGLEFESQEMEEWLHAHNKAIFDSVNEVLMEFQPYFATKGEPFPWSQNFESAFYFISEENLAALVAQIKDRLWNYSNTLAGIHLDTETPQKYKFHVQRILKHENALLQMDKYPNDHIEIDDTRTAVLAQIADQIESSLYEEIFSFLESS